MLIPPGITVIIVQAPQQIYMPDDIHMFIPLLYFKFNLILILIIINFNNVWVMQYVNLTSMSDDDMVVLKNVEEQGTNEL
jgi:hypothetical protein